jgi:hypothetical protein
MSASGQCILSDLRSSTLLAGKLDALKRKSTRPRSELEPPAITVTLHLYSLSSVSPNHAFSLVVGGHICTGGFEVSCSKDTSAQTMLQPWSQSMEVVLSMVKPPLSYAFYNYPKCCSLCISVRSLHGCFVYVYYRQSLLLWSRSVPETVRTPAVAIVRVSLLSG